MNKLLAFRPPRIALVLLAITLAVWHLSPPHTLLHMPYKLLGTVGTAFGLTLMTWSWLQFKKHGTAVCPTAESSSIVTGGAYKYSRNPMYLGMVAILLGAAFFMGTIESMIAPAVFFLILDKVLIPYEEDKLLARFGEEYQAYMSGVRRWL